jgi:hypothetical protein
LGWAAKFGRIEKVECYQSFENIHLKTFEKRQWLILLPRSGKMNLDRRFNAD